MRPRRIIAPTEAKEIFDQAVRERALVVVSVQSGEEWETYKSRFLERDPQHRFFVLDYQPFGDEVLPALGPGQYAGISFRYRSRKIMFSTVVEAKGRYVLDDKTAVAALRFRWPETMTELQRRAYYRTPIPNGTTLLAHLWEGGVGGRAAAQESPLGVVTGSLVDISCGGCLIRLNQVQAPAWPDNATLGIELQLPDGRPPVLVNAHHRGARHDAAGHLCVAVQFVGLELSMDGRVVLQRLATNIQKFHRMTAAADLRQQETGWGF
jgi:c-di-GMP-binding flagellar brake protein YcgR